MRLTPFRALRYDPDVAGPAAQTSAPPYDALDPLRYASHRVANPYTVLQLIAGESGDGFGPARTALQRWLRTGVLLEDTDPALYLYEQHELRHGVPAVQRGVVGTLALADVDDGHLLPHEDVDPDRAALRAARMHEVPVDLTPVVAVHVGGADPSLGEQLDRARAGGPVVAFTDEQNVDHRIWRIASPEAIRAITDGLADTRAVVADGHHRIAAARHVRDARTAAGRTAAPWDRLTVWVVDALTGGPELRAVHRLVPAAPAAVAGTGAPDIPGFHALAWDQGVHALEAALQQMPSLAVGLVTPDRAWVLRPDEAALRRLLVDVPPALRVLDAKVVADVVTPAIDPSAASEAVFDLDEALRQIHGPGGGTLLLLRAPTAAQVLAVAEADLRMPPKTTWFRPKPRAGLLMRRLDLPG